MIVTHDCYQNDPHLAIVNLHWRNDNSSTIIAKGVKQLLLKNLLVLVIFSINEYYSYKSRLRQQCCKEFMYDLNGQKIKIMCVDAFI